MHYRNIFHQFFSALEGQCFHPDDIYEDASGSSSGLTAGQLQDSIVLLQTLAGILPLTALINLNSDLFLAQPIASVLNPTT
ncbi:unnamed protein product [Rotaria sp. Silwood1]|nr:unnamed protein product [Rotaria sp. Silwood1]